jgi:long-chain acyl-CoA synthetase
MYNLACLLAYQAAYRPDHCFLTFEEEACSYKQCENQAIDIACHLIRKGAVPKSKIIIDCIDERTYVSALFGVWRIGAIAIPVQPQLTDAEKEMLSRIVEAEFVITDSLHAWPGNRVKMIRAGEWEQAKESIPVHAAAPDDVAEILFTSGSSGKPKGVMLTHSNILMNAIESVQALALTHKDIQYATVPLAHAFGQNRAVICSVYTGATVHAASRLDMRRKIACIERVNPTVIIGLPSYYSMLVASKPVLPRLRAAVSASAPLSPSTQEKFEAIYGVPILVGYGLSECSPVIATQTLDMPRVAGSVGRAIRGVEIRIVDEDGNVVEPGNPGSIRVRGHNVMKGYYGLPPGEGFDESGWFMTGDIGKMDAEGNLFLLGRETGFIKRFGYKVFPIEIQNVLLSHPGVLDAAAVIIHRQVTGEDLIAYVKPAAEAKITQTDLIEFCKQKLAFYKVPSRIDIVEEIPALPSGKPLIVQQSQ